MKKIFKQAVVIVIVAIALVSCQKDNIVPSAPLCVNVNRSTDGNMKSIQHGCATHDIEFSPGKNYDEIIKKNHGER